MPHTPMHQGARLPKNEEPDLVLRMVPLAKRWPWSIYAPSILATSPFRAHLQLSKTGVIDPVCVVE
jgi:hypothetical protein